MGDWGRYHGEIFHQEDSNSMPRSMSRRPPSGLWQPTVPSWEKKFCYSTCSIPWRKLLETKKVMNFYQNIVEWNDSAGEEAFQNAKARFWADINGLPCNISLPSPDIYIDEVDWNCVIDPELLFDLDQPLQPLDDVEDRKPGFLRSGWDSYLTSDKPVACTGWSDGDESAKPAGWADNEVPVKPTGWGEDAAEPAMPVHDSFTNPGWESCGKNATENEGWCSSDNNNINNGTLDWNKWDNRAEDNSSWRKGTLDSCGWEQSKSNNHNLESFDDSKMGGNWGMSNNWRREGGNPKLSRYRTSRYQQRGYDFQANSNGMGNARGRKRVNFTSVRPELEKRPLASRQWNALHSCGSRNHHHHGVAEVSDTWNWEKPVS